MNEAPGAGGVSAGDLVYRFRRWLFGGLAVAVAIYLGGSIYAGFREVGSELVEFHWLLMAPVLLLTLVNYGLRFLKWHYLLHRLGIHVSWGDDALIFGCGLAMVISPGKAGEILKPWLVRVRTGVGMATTIPALVAERLTDGIAMVFLAALSVTTYAADRVHYVLIPAGAILALIAVLASKRLSMGLIGLLVRLPLLGSLAGKLQETYLAMRTCLALAPFLIIIGLSVAAWWAECVGYWLVFRGFGVEATIDLSTFLYAFATIAGGALPGGLGVADGALGGGAWELVPGITEAQAVASALLIRFATLWFGVGIGTALLFRLGNLIVHWTEGQKQ